MNFDTLCEAAVFSCGKPFDPLVWRLGIFIPALNKLSRSGMWVATLDHRYIHLRRQGSEHLYSPLTASYWRSTNIDLHRGSYFHPEIQEYFNIPWYEVLAISYAESGSDGGGYRYDRNLRNQILIAVKLPPEKST